MRRISLLVAGFLAAAVLALPGLAQAQGSSQCQAYNPQVPCQPPVSLKHTPQGDLPFTGIDVALLASGGLVMLAAGFGIRRLSRRLS